MWHYCISSEFTSENSPLGCVCVGGGTLMGHYPSWYIQKGDKKEMQLGQGCKPGFALENIFPCCFNSHLTSLELFMFPRWTCHVKSQCWAEVFCFTKIWTTNCSLYLNCETDPVTVPTKHIKDSEVSFTPWHIYRCEHITIVICALSSRGTFWHCLIFLHNNFFYFLCNYLCNSQ